MCIPQKSKYHLIWEAFLNGEFCLCISNEILNEYEETLTKHSSPVFADLIVRTIMKSQNIQLVSPTFRFNLIKADPDDNKFVDCAIIANAEYIVSQDKHFLVLKSIDFPKVEVIGIDDFVENLSY
jgi:putative PIN family toxin of toxin-antitoxin system